MDYIPLRFIALFSYLMGVLVSSGSCSNPLSEGESKPLQQIAPAKLYKVTQNEESSKASFNSKKRSSLTKGKSQTAGIKKTQGLKRPIGAIQTSLDSFMVSNKKIKLNESTDDIYSVTSDPSSQETLIDLTREDDKENQSALANTQLPYRSEADDLKKETKVKLFNLQLRQPDYSHFEKEKIIAKPWPISMNGNPTIEISALQSPDGNKHRIVITHYKNDKENKIYYSAFIDQTQLSYWHHDSSSIKRAAVNKIYNKLS